MDFLTTAFVSMTIMAVFCFITQRFTKHNYDRFDTITIFFISCFSGLVVVTYRVIYEVQTAYNYKQGVEHGFTANIYELVTTLPYVAFSDNWLSLTLWFFITVVIVTALQFYIKLLVTYVWSTANAGYSKVVFDFKIEYTEKVAYITTSVCIVAISIGLAVCTHQDSFLSHEDYSAYDMSKKIEVSEDLVSAISRQCKGMNVATIIRNRIYCEEQVGDMYYVLSESVTFYDHDMGKAINLYQENGINSDPMSKLEHMFVLTWDSKTISDRSLFFMVRKDIDPPKLDPSSISSWGTRYFKNLEKLIPQMPEAENAAIKVNSPFGDEWSELEVSLDK